VVREDAARIGTSSIICDLSTTAKSTGDANGGADATQEFAIGASRSGLAMIVLAQLPQTAERFPPYPLGSVFAHNLAQMTWAVEAPPSDDFDRGQYLPAVDRAARAVQPETRPWGAGARAVPVVLVLPRLGRDP
jgi:hypothetical protein